MTFDAIAGAVVAGHVIECGAQCCGGNYAFFEEVPGRERIGFPLAEVHVGRLVGDHQAPGDGRHGDARDGDGPAPLRDRRPALPEPRRRGALRQHRAGAGGPRPGAHHGRAGRAAARHAEGHGQSRCRLAQRHDAGPDRRPGGREGPVRRRGGVGRHPGRARRLRRDRGGPLGRPRPAAAWPTCAWRCAATTSRRSAGPSPAPSSRPACRATPAPSSPPRPRAPRASPATGRRRSVPPPSPRASSATADRSRPRPRSPLGGASGAAPRPAERHRGAGAGPDGATPSWCRSGCSSVPARGTREATPTSGSGPTTTPWRPGCSATSPPRLFKELLPEVEPCAVSRYPLPNLRAVNFVVHGLLGWGVASNLRLDTQAKGLGELLRSRRSRCRPRSLPAGRPRRGSPHLTPTRGWRPGIWQDVAVESVARLIALVAGHRLVSSRRGACSPRSSSPGSRPRRPCACWPGPRRLGPPDRPEAPGLRDA